MSNKLSVPEEKPYLIDSVTRSLLEFVDADSKEGNNTNILIRGYSGCGKSDLVNQFAATRKRPLAVMEVGRLSESSQIFGSKTIKDGSIVYQQGLFLEAIQTPNAVVHLQELNRAETDKALNGIFSVLDETFRGIWMDELQQVIKVAPGVTFFATVNEGFQFIGTMPLDDALANRFAINIELGYLPQKNEEFILQTKTGINHDLARLIVGMANTFRNQSKDPLHVSIRQVLAMGKLCKFGTPLQVAIKSTLPKIDNVQLEQVLFGLQMGGDTTELEKTKEWLKTATTTYGAM